MQGYGHTVWEAGMRVRMYACMVCMYACMYLCISLRYGNTVCEAGVRLCMYKYTCIATFIELVTHIHAMGICYRKAELCRTQIIHNVKGMGICIMGSRNAYTHTHAHTYTCI